MRRRWLLLLLLPLLWSAAASAHKASDSYLRLQVDGQNIDGRWDIALRDLHALLTLDGNGDGAITWGELRARRHDVAAAALGSLRVTASGQQCALRVPRLRVVDHSDGSYAALDMAGRCPTAAAQIALEYDFLFGFDPSHRGLLNLDFGGQHSAIFAPGQRRIVFERGAASGPVVFVRYLRAGAGHVWAGLDHLLFLICLLLPAVLRQSATGWVAVADGRRAFYDIAKIVTAFTLAHTVSLTAAALEWLRPPTRWVEVAVAATIIAAALNNLRPLVRVERLWTVAFGFGLIHGAAYASVLGGLGLPVGALTIALLGFNLGVEGGQILFIIVTMPLAFAARRHWWYRPIVVVPGSVLIALLAAIWLLQRAFDLRLQGLW